MRVAIVLLTVWAMPLLAHENKPFLLNGKLVIVPEFGIVTSTITSTPSIAEPGFTGGVGLRLGGRKHLYTGLYLRAVRFSAQIDASGLNSSRFNLFHSAYLVVPVMYGRTVFDRAFVKIRLFGGGLMMFQQGVISGGFTRNDMNYTLWGARGGAGVGLGKLELNGSLDMGFNQMFSQVSNGRFLGANLTLGYRF